MFETAAKRQVLDRRFTQANRNRLAKPLAHRYQIEHALQLILGDMGDDRDVRLDAACWLFLVMLISGLDYPRRLAPCDETVLPSRFIAVSALEELALIHQQALVVDALGDNFFLTLFVDLGHLVADLPDQALRPKTAARMQYLHPIRFNARHQPGGYGRRWCPCATFRVSPTRRAK